MSAPLGGRPLGYSGVTATPIGAALPVLPILARLRTRTGSYVTPAPVIADIFAWGAGGSGTADAVLQFGGGGAAAGYSRLIIPGGVTISWSAPQATIGVSASTSGNQGGDTTVTVDGVTMTAQGGRAPSGAAAGRAFASGFQVNRYGGGSGEAGEHGAPPAFGGNLAGGGAGGFKDLFGDYTAEPGYPQYGGNGALIVPGPGAGGGATFAGGGNYSTWGGAGAVDITIYRQ